MIRFKLVVGYFEGRILPLLWYQFGMMRLSARRLPLAFCLLGLLAIGLGVLVYRRYLASEQHILEALRTVSHRGRHLDPEQCVDEIVSWSRRCEAMRSMCEWTTRRMMLICLSARDRQAYCADLTVSTGDTRFGYHECRVRGAAAGLPKKACANAYRAIDQHCRSLQGDS